MHALKCPLCVAGYMMFRKMLEEKLMEEKRKEEEKKRREEAGRRRKKSESSSDESLSLSDLGLLPVLAILKHLMDDSDDDDDDEPAKKVHNVTSKLPNVKGSRKLPAPLFTRSHHAPTH